MRETLKSAIAWGAVPLLLVGIFLWRRLDHLSPAVTDSSAADSKDAVASEREMLKLMVDDPLYKELGAGETIRELIRKIDLATGERHEPLAPPQSELRPECEQFAWDGHRIIYRDKLPAACGAK
jgi:hypothetical protein